VHWYYWTYSLLYYCNSQSLRPSLGHHRSPGHNRSQSTTLVVYFLQVIPLLWMPICKDCLSKPVC